MRIGGKKARLVGDRPTHAQPVFVTDLLKGEVILHNPDFLVQRHRLLLARLQGVTQHVREARDGFACAGRILIDEGAQTVERIEEEVRIDL